MRAKIVGCPQSATAQMGRCRFVGCSRGSYPLGCLWIAGVFTLAARDEAYPDAPLDGPSPLAGRDGGVVAMEQFGTCSLPSVDSFCLSDRHNVILSD
jgi:hypothetical protein